MWSKFIWFPKSIIWSPKQFFPILHTNNEFHRHQHCRLDLQRSDAVIYSLADPQLERCIDKQAFKKSQRNSTSMTDYSKCTVSTVLVELLFTKCTVSTVELLFTKCTVSRLELINNSSLN